MGALPFRTTPATILLVGVFWALFHLTAPDTAYGQGVELEVGPLVFSAMPLWIYNGFTTTEDGSPVQGSDVSPQRMSFGAGVVLDLTPAMRLEPNLWIYRQEYIALNAHDTVVPTQIETGSVSGQIADTLSLALSVPWYYRLPWPSHPAWDLSVGAGLALIFRIPLREIDSSGTGEVGRYWIAGRFVYPELGFAVDYRLTDTVQVGGGLTWYVPIYNLWSDAPPGVSFLDETMLRWGLRITYDLF